MLEQAVKRVDEVHRNTISRSNNDAYDGQLFENFTLLDLHSNGPLIIPILGSQYENVKWRRMNSPFFILTMSFNQMIFFVLKILSTLLVANLC